MIHPNVKMDNLVPFLEKSLNSKVLDCSVSLLSTQGFGSTMLSVKVKVETNKRNGVSVESKTIELVVKTPVTNTVFASMFQPTESCIKENCFYTEIIPSLLQLQRERGLAENELIDIFIRCYGARLSLNPDSKIADNDSLLVLENIKVRGYQTGNCAVGFDKYDTLKVLEKMSEFHALPIALRLLNSKVFEEKVKPFLKPIDLYVNYDSENIITESICASIDKIKNLDNCLREKVIRQLNVCNVWRKDTNLQADTPYTTVVHRDLWINNIMYTRDTSQHISKIKLCDYQLTGYYSFSNDLIFFLFSSVDTKMRIENFEFLIKQYHSHFVDALTQLGCPLDDYAYEKFYAEIKENAKYELEHIILMLKVILADKEKCPKMCDLDFNFVIKDDHLNDTFYEQLHMFLKEFDALGFL